jgi:hypothetical protein
LDPCAFRRRTARASSVRRVVRWPAASSPDSSFPYPALSLACSVNFEFLVLLTAGGRRRGGAINSGLLRPVPGCSGRRRAVWKVPAASASPTAVHAKFRSEISPPPVNFKNQPNAAYFRSLFLHFAYFAYFSYFAAYFGHFLLLSRLTVIFFLFCIF